LSGAFKNVILQNSPYSVIDWGLFRRAVEDASPYNLCIFTIMLIYSNEELIFKEVLTIFTAKEGAVSAWNRRADDART
jgi:hypothetical protein